MKNHYKKIGFSGYSIAIIAILGLLLIVALSYFWHNSRIIGDVMIGQQVFKLRNIFNKIDATCGIIGFEHQRNYIDFLTVKSFVGSEVGAMNLVNPGNWQGPYVEDNPTVQQKLFEIIRIQRGHYIVPGDGVKLSNGKVIGKDIVFDEHTDMQALLAHGGDLNFKGQALAALLEIKMLADNVSAQDSLMAQVHD